MIGIEEYIKDLSPEMQAKAKACTNMDELLKLADENDIELPREALAQVAGGCGKKEPEKPKCPNCRSENLSSVVVDGQTKTKCNNCQLIY